MAIEEAARAPLLQDLECVDIREADGLISGSVDSVRTAHDKLAYPKQILCIGPLVAKSVLCVLNMELIPVGWR